MKDLEEVNVLLLPTAVEINLNLIYTLCNIVYKREGDDLVDHRN